ncbi:MAG: hypothetical protein AB9891_07180 [Anaerolineaceae bacterium]
MISEENSKILSMNPATSYKWYQAWKKALTKPSLATFEELIHDPRASAKRAYCWMFFSSLILGGITSLITLILNFLSFPESIIFSQLINDFLGNGLIFAVISVLYLIGNAGVLHLIAHALRGTGSFSKLVYALAVYRSPLYLIVGIGKLIFGLNPCLVMLILQPSVIFCIILDILATRVVNQFNLGRAVLTNAIIIFPIAISIVILVIWPFDTLMFFNSLSQRINDINPYLTQAINHLLF